MSTAWLHGWPLYGDTVLMGTGVHCAGCGRDFGTATVAFPESWTPPGPEPEWPFDEESCPVHGGKPPPDDPCRVCGGTGVRPGSRHTGSAFAEHDGYPLHTHINGVKPFDPQYVIPHHSHGRLP